MNTSCGRPNCQGHSKVVAASCLVTSAAAAVHVAGFPLLRELLRAYPAVQGTFHSTPALQRCPPLLQHMNITLLGAHRSMLDAPVQVPKHYQACSRRTTASSQSECMSSNGSQVLPSTAWQLTTASTPELGASPAFLDRQHSTVTAYPPPPPVLHKL